MASAASALTGRRRKQSGGAPVDCDIYDGLAIEAHGLGPGLQFRSLDTELLEEPLLPTATSCPPTIPRRLCR